MKNNIQAVSGYNFTYQDKLFLDANIWMCLYGPQRQRRAKVQTYSKVFQDILHAKCQIYIDVLIVSELINSWARLKWGLVASCYRDFKAFRNSPHFKPVAQDIAADAKHVIGHCSPIESGFATLAIDDLLTDYDAGNSDFNDQVINELCKSNGLTLITHDSDFSSQGISILTANNQLLGIT